MDKHKDIINRVGEALQQPIPKAVKPYVEELESVRFKLAEARADAMQLLYEKRRQMLWPKDTAEKLTELDRTTRLNGDVAVLERDYQFLNRLEKLLDDRIELAVTYL